MNHKTRAILAVLALLSTSVASAFAQEEVSALPNLIVTATRTPLSDKKVTHSVQVFTEEDIKNQHVTDLLELLRDAAGLSVSQTGSRGSSTSIFARGSQSNHTLVLIDGVRVNNAGGSFNFADVTLENVERVEVLRGPQSSLYGSDAMGGVIQIFTKKQGKTEKSQASLEFRGGKNNTFEEILGLSGSAGQKGGYSVGFTRVDSDGVLDLNNKFKENNFTASLTQQPFANVNFQSSLRYSDGEFNFPTNGSGDVFMLATQFDPQQKTKTKRVTLSAQLSHELNQYFSHSLLLGLNQEDVFSSDPSNGPVIDPFGASQSETTQQRDSLDYQWRIKTPEWNKINSELDAGVAVEKESYENTSAFSSEDRLRNNAAFYLQKQIRWNEMVFLTPGVRFEDNQNFGGAMSPRVTGGVFLPWTQTKLRGSWGDAIKAPSFDQIYGGGFANGNRNLKPERMEGWEGGFDQYFLGGKITAGFSYFENRYRDLIAFISAVGSNPNFINVQSAKAYGTESTVKFSETFGAFTPSLTLTHTYVKTRTLDSGPSGAPGFVQDQPLLRRPEHRGSVTVNLAHRRFNLNVNTTIVGRAIDVFGSTRVEVAGYKKVDVAGSVLVWEKNDTQVRVVGKVENLTDDPYNEVYGFSGLRTAGQLGLRVDF